MEGWGVISSLVFFVLSSYFGYFSKYKCDANVLFRSNYAFHNS